MFGSGTDDILERQPAYSNPWPWRTSATPCSEGDPVYRYRRALEEILRTLGPASCKCEGLQAEVDEAIQVATLALAEQ